MKLKHLNLIVTAILVCATLGIEYLVRPEEISALYKFNIAVILLLEVLIVNSLFFTAKKENYSVQSIAVATRVLKYSIFSILWLVVYSLMLTEVFDVKYYYVVHIALLAWFSISAFTTYVAGQKQIEVNTEQQERVERREQSRVDVFTSKLVIVKNLTKSTIDAKAKRNISSKLEVIYDKLRFSASILGQDTQVQLYLEELKMLSEQLQTEPLDQTLVAAIEEKIGDTIEYIDSKK